MSVQLNCVHCRCSNFHANPFYPQLCSNDTCVHDRVDHVESVPGKGKRKRASVSRRSDLPKPPPSAPPPEAPKNRSADRHRLYVSMLERARTSPETVSILRKSHFGRGRRLDETLQKLMSELFDRQQPITAAREAFPAPEEPPLSPISPASASGEEEAAATVRSPPPPLLLPPTMQEKSAAAAATSEGGPPPGAPERWFSYVGPWSGERMGGHGGRCWFEEGGEYDGDWSDGWPHGRGRATYADGSSFEGKWVAGLPHGRGTLRSAGEPMEIIGEWERGRLEGVALCRLADGSEERLVFHEGRRQ